MKFEFVEDEIEGTLPTFVKRAVAFLSTVPDGRLYPGKGMAAQIGYIGGSALGKHCSHPALKSYRVRVKSGKVKWGNPKTIKCFVEQYPHLVHPEN